MSEARYLCWGPDQEDLTVQVERAIASKPEVHVRVMKPEAVADRSSTNAVVVYCSKGDENVFYVKDDE